MQTSTDSSSQQADPQPPVSEPAGLLDRIIMLTAIVVPFVGVIAAIYYSWTIGWMGWPYLILLIVAWMISGMGITIGFHRLLTHNSFETYRPIRAALMMMGALSVEGSPLVWCAVHRRHHELSDKPGDPHSPHLHGEGWWNAIKGFWYGHCGWLLTTFWSDPDLKRYVPDLLRDRLLVVVDRMYYVWVLLSLAIPTVIGWLITMNWQGAFLGLLWGGLVRIFIGHHITWSINSVCHIFGGRPFQSNDRSTNNLMCALLGFGEGWHNNHHAFPTSARHGLWWWQFDMSWLTILALKKLGLAWNVKVPSPKAIEAKRAGH
jgi:stearoyl-CoA desaturase (delta-9 desaturase)